MQSFYPRSIELAAAPATQCFNSSKLKIAVAQVVGHQLQRSNEKVLPRIALEQGTSLPSLL